MRGNTARPLLAAAAVTAVAMMLPAAVGAVTLDQLQKVERAQQRSTLAAARQAVTEGRLSDAERLLEQARNTAPNPSELQEVASLIADAHAEQQRRMAAAEDERRRAAAEEEKRRIAAAAAGSPPSPSYSGTASSSPAASPYNTVSVKFDLNVGSLDSATKVILTRRDAYGILRAETGVMGEAKFFNVSTGVYDMEVELQVVIRESFFGQVGNPLFGGSQTPRPGRYTARYSFSGVQVGCPYLWLTLAFGAGNQEARLSGRCG